jgi:hypothetical protein
MCARSRAARTAYAEIVCVLAQLEALGDDLLEGGQSDLSYLDEATAAPDVPTTAPASKQQQACVFC